MVELASETVFLLKLKHDIRVESKVWIEREEIHSLTGIRPEPVESIASLFKSPPFVRIEDDIVKIIDRFPYLGKIQAFLLKGGVNLNKILKRSTLLKEVFVVITGSSLAELKMGMKEIGLEGNKLLEGILKPNIQLFLRKDDRGFVAVVRGIPIQRLMEDSLEILKLPKVAFVKQGDLSKRLAIKERAIEGYIDELFDYILNVHDRPPRVGLYKNHIGDYIDWAYSKFKQYGLHFIHVHRAKADPRLARMVLNLLDVKEGDIVLDPFCGSGTFIADAPLMGINAYGIDVNPLSSLIASVKSNLWLDIESLREVLIRISEEIYKTKTEPDKDINHIIRLLPTSKSKKVREKREKVTQILAIKRLIDQVESKDLRDFLYVMLSRVIVDEFSHKRGVNVREKFIEDSMQFYLTLYITQKVLKKLGMESKGWVKIINGDIRTIKFEDTVDGILTSPPYFDAINYLDETSVYSLAILGLVKDPIENLGAKIIGSKYVNPVKMDDLPSSGLEVISVLSKYRRSAKARTIAKYMLDMKHSFRILHHILEDNGKMIFVVGKYHHWAIGKDIVRVDGARIIADLAESEGFTLINELIHEIHKIDPGVRVNMESILIFKKGESKQRKKGKVIEIFRGRPTSEVKRFIMESAISSTLEEFIDE